MERYICIHGHFYQPPRENPWLEEIEEQDSAYPFHDWNERITAECYATNARSRVLDAKGYITSIVNNYARMSFNFGPTLLSWMQHKAPEVYQAILEADRLSQERFSGHGSAMAQAFGHIILPLANTRDKRTQIEWGIRDFERRYRRKPEGMWLAETAVDLESLDLMAEYGIKFTVLSPYQAKAVRPLGEDSPGNPAPEARGRDWHDVSGGNVNPRRPYLQKLPSGRSIVLFFYDGPISQAVAFERLLTSGERFAKRLIDGFHTEGDAEPRQLVHIATDGETYGHHHRFGDMALAYALNYIEDKHLAKLTNYGEYIGKFPPAWECEIHENTSWSCAHGVERWRSDCGCNTGGREGWNQQWRRPLRDSLNRLRDELAPRFEEKAGQLVRDPWAARQDYIDVLLDRSPESIDRFIGKHATREIGDVERREILKLFELQRHAMLMFTSCGWFFDDISGIETVQVMAYAGRAIQLADELGLGDYEEQFLHGLEKAKSNVPANVNGRACYERFVKPAMLDLERVAVHFAINLIFEEPAGHNRIYCYAADVLDYQEHETGDTKLVMGRAQVSSEITLDRAEFAFASLHLGDHNVTAGVHAALSREYYKSAAKELPEVFRRMDIPEMVRTMDRHFGGATNTIRSLFRDEQRNVIRRILGPTIEQIADEYERIYDRHSTLLRFLAELGIPQPRELQMVGELILQRRVRQALTTTEIDREQVLSLVGEAKARSLPLDTDQLGRFFQRTIERLLSAFAADPEEIGVLELADEAVSLLPELPFEVDTWSAQNLVWDTGRDRRGEFASRAENGDSAAKRWIELFDSLAHRLHMRTPPS